MKLDTQLSCTPPMIALIKVSILGIFYASEPSIALTKDQLQEQLKLMHPELKPHDLSDVIYSALKQLGAEKQLKGFYPLGAIKLHWCRKSDQTIID